MNNVTVPASARHLAPVLCAATLLLGGCGGGGGGGDGGNDNPVPLNDPNALMQALADKVDAGALMIEIENGVPPANAGEEGPKVTEGISESTAVPGDMVAVPVRIDGGPDLSNLYAKITGATNFYFNVPVGGDGGGKSGEKPWISVRKQEFGFIALTTLDFRAELPENLDLATGNEICFDLSVEGSDGSISTVANPCISIGAQRPAVIDDQPPGAEMPERLDGTWLSSCLDIVDFAAGEATIRAARLGLIFTAEGTTYTEAAYTYTADDCSAGEAITPQVSGTYVIGGEIDSNQNSLRTRAIDFEPTVDPQTNTPVPCFNRLRIADEDGDDNYELLFLGVPRTSYPGQANALPDDCRAEDTRPGYVLTSLPFSKQ